MTDKHTENTFIRQLDDNLILRRAAPADTDRLVEFNARVHSDDGWEHPFQPVGDWVRDLMTKDHPTFQPELFTIVEDTRTGEIVSSLNTIPQTWTYAGIAFKVGRPELVGTHPDYRNRGLVRAQFEVIHHWGAQRGEQMQVITGIPYYYRLFGYEMAVNLGGGRSGYAVNVPELKEDEPEPYRLRPAREQDLPFIQEVYDYGARRSLLTCQRDAALWQYELSGHSQTSINGRQLVVIEEAGSGERQGFVVHPRHLWGPALAVTRYELKAGASWLDITPSVIRYIYEKGKSYQETGKPKCEAYTFTLGAEHPVFEAALDRLPRQYPPYAYYIRIPDLPAFLKLIQPVLEERLAGSLAAGYSGQLRLSFYRQGLKMAFEKGAITTIEPWQPTPLGQSGEAVFPSLTFLQLVFGYRSLAELEYAYPDLAHRGDAPRVLLNSLFPKLHSDVWPVN